MSAIARSLSIALLVCELVSCADAPGATREPGPTGAASPAKKIAPTAFTLPIDLAFAGPLVELLSNAGLAVEAVRSSVYTSFFQSTDQAAWIKTDQGIVEAVFFVDPAEAVQIRLTTLAGEAGRYIYKIQAPAPTLSHDVTIDAAFPLYFTMPDSMFLVTSSAELDETLKRILPGQ